MVFIGFATGRVQALVMCCVMGTCEGARVVELDRTATVRAPTAEVGPRSRVDLDESVAPCLARAARGVSGRVPRVAAALHSDSTGRVREVMGH